MPSLLRLLFSRLLRFAGRRGRSRFGIAIHRSFGRIATSGRLRGLEGLESRAMLAADDILVSLVGDQVVLALDPAGAQISDLSTSYAANTGLLTINAVTAGTL